MTVTCPEGHQSEATDYCDTCGTPIQGGESGAGSAGSTGSAGGAGMPGAVGASGGGSSAPGPVIPQAVDGSALDLGPAPSPTLTCPHCDALNVADALFCEACGYDFTTGAAPLGTEPVVPDEGDGERDGDSALDLGLEGEDEISQDRSEIEATTADGPVPAEGSAHEDQPESDKGEAAGEGEPSPELDEGEGKGEPEPEPDEGEGEPEPEDEDEEPDAGAGGEPEPDPEPQPDAAPEPDPEPEPEPDAAPEPDPEPAVAAHAKPRHTPPSRSLSDTWVVEVWVDPDWYAVQQTEEACPSPGLPDIVVVRRNVVLIGRPSGSLGVRPDVDSGGDSAVSRRHAQLTSDGSRWWIEDLGSSNGTYVGSVGEPLPTEPIRQRVEIDRDDRIYVGAWTRLVLRQATASEQAGQG